MIVRMAVVLLAFAWPSVLAGSPLDSIRTALERSSVSRVQEKVYVHTDNSAYFVGDTLWYKAYVVRADNLRPTDMSRILYVELLSPDGMVVERQSVIVSDRGFSCGSFAISDSLFSGYYELRAYTRWMLNFNVSQHSHTRNDTHYFYNKAMAADYFRHWEGLYSRVFPVYEQPDTAGDYSVRRIYDRPRQRLPRRPAPALHAGFYPEGGSMVAGVPSRVAFELTDENGAAVDISGKIMSAGRQVQTVSTSYMGRGSFVVTPGDAPLRAVFSWRGRDYSFDLPRAAASGAVMTLSEGSVGLSFRGLPQGDYGLSVLCRGVLRHFAAVTPDASGRAVVPLPDSLPAGVNDITLFDASGRILADRLFFVRPADSIAATFTVDGGLKASYAPYERVDLCLSAPGVSAPSLISVSVTDASADGPTYDDGNIMTDLLLGSELRGFIASPSYYFADASPERAEALDLLMLVQGWRRYRWTDLAATEPAPLRYTPEKTLTVEGHVYKMTDVNDIDPADIRHWATGNIAVKDEDEPETEATPAATEGGGDLAADGGNTLVGGVESTGGVEPAESPLGDINRADDNIGVNHASLKKRVLVEAEVIFGTEVLGSVQATAPDGHYIFEIPPYYGDAILKMKAYREKDSLKKSMLAAADKGYARETAIPDFYVKRDLFFPRYADRYGYYQTHEPEVPLAGLTPAADTLLSMEREVYRLKDISVSGRRRAVAP